MDVGEAAMHAASAGGGAVTVGWVVRLLLKSWVEKHDAMAMELKALAKCVLDLKLEVTKFGFVIAHFDKVDQRSQELDRGLSVMDHRVSEIEGALNGLDTKKAWKRYND